MVCLYRLTWRFFDIPGSAVRQQVIKPSPMLELKLRFGFRAHRLAHLGLGFVPRQTTTLNALYGPLCI